jgi:hypothetical protein
MGNFSKNLKFDHAFVVIRIDEFMAKYSVEDQIAAVKAYWNPEDAQQEVERLNKLNGDKGCHYFWQVVRIEKKKREFDDDE